MKSLLGTQGRPARDLTLALFEGSRGIARTWVNGRSMRCC